MEHSNVSPFPGQSVQQPGDQGKVNWPVVVVAVAGISTVVWTYVVVRTVFQIVQFAVS